MPITICLAVYPELGVTSYSVTKLRNIATTFKVTN